MNTEKYMANHTTISYLTEKEWSQIPYLKDNNGKLPPFVIAVGDVRRLHVACDVLELKNIVKLHEEGKKLIGPKGSGRVDSLIGCYEHEGKTLPLVMVETQMGMPATEINLREICANCSQTYQLGDQKIETNALSLIRVGTAGGINDPSSDSIDTKIGDIINSTFSIGWSGTLIESMAGLNYGSSEVIAKFKKQWVNAGYCFTEDGEHPKAQSSQLIVDAINKAAKELGKNVIEGGNFSKDSFYAEIDEQLFINLRKKYNVMSTEMEQMAVLKLVDDFRKFDITLNTGLVSGIIGTIPGWTFETGEAAEEVEKNALKVAAHALWNICYD